MKNDSAQWEALTETTVHALQITLSTLFLPPDVSVPTVSHANPLTWVELETRL